MSKTILITGTSSGFGRDTAETLRAPATRCSPRCAIPRARTASTPRHCAPRHRSGRARRHRRSSVEAGREKDAGRADRIDVLVNNAGIASAGVTEAFTPDQAKVVFNTNVVGLLRTTRAVLPAMRRQGDGLIVNIGSILGRVTFPFFGIYGASKFAVEALTDSLRYEVSQLGIDVVPVQPSALPDRHVTQHSDSRPASRPGRVL